jgi:hypothetical protein
MQNGVRDTSGRLFLFDDVHNSLGIYIRETAKARLKTAKSCQFKKEQPLLSTSLDVVVFTP